MGARPTRLQQLDIAKRRERLLARIISFQDQAEIFMSALNIESSQPELVDEDWSDEETDNKGPEELFELAQDGVQHLSVGSVESITLFLPSTFGEDSCKHAGLTTVILKEIALREGQANDSLHQLRLSIGQKSFLFRTQLRNAASKTRKTKAWDDISAVGNTVSHHRRVYHSARDALIALGAPSEVLNKYQVIHTKDVRSSTAIVDPNARGQRNVSLPWFWSVGVKRADGALMTECELLHVIFVT